MAVPASRMNPRLSLTPRPSAHFRSPSPRSPAKQSRQESDFGLSKIIGTTASSVNGVDSLESTNTFAFVAGAVAVLATLDEDLQLSQRFFRAKASACSVNPTPPLYDSPSFGASKGSRSRAAASLVSSGIGGSSYASPWGDSVDAANAYHGTGSQRSKAATCLSLSRDGRLLALGEVGHRPRILIFSTAREVPGDIPLTSISEHTFGVRCLAFSPDSQYLASLGDINDGFLYIWNINARTGAATLHSSNRCTSYIRQIVWLENNLITVGTRHVKIWRIGETKRPSPNKRTSDAAFAFASPSRALAGRNCLLGTLLDKTFTAALAISSTQALVCSEDGDVCLLDNGNTTPSFQKVADAGFCVNTISKLNAKSVLVAGNGGQLKIFQNTDFSSSSIFSLPQVVKGCKDTQPESDMISVSVLDGCIVAMDSERNTLVLELSSSIIDAPVATVKKSFPAHAGPVLGTKSLTGSESSSAAFLTWSSEGTVLFWDIAGAYQNHIKVPLPQEGFEDLESGNELKAVTLFRDQSLIATGDKSGVLQILSATTGATLQALRAHSGEITDIAVFEQDTNLYLATSGRDRIVQVFVWKSETCSLVQTLDDHTGAVSRVVFSSGATRLVSCSADRTIVVRDIVSAEIDGEATTAFVPNRIITLKSSPLHMQTLTSAGNKILVSTADRYVLKYDIETGNLISSFKTSDNDGGDSIGLNWILSLQLEKHGSVTAGVSSFDKSLRIYNEDGQLLALDFGHTEGITGMTQFEDDEKQTNLVTVATDGTIFIWRPFAGGVERLQESFESLSISNLNTPDSSPVLPAGPPLRRVLSASALKQVEASRRESAADSSPTATPGTPASPAQHLLRRKTSRLSILSTPKLEPSPLSKVQRTRETLTPPSIREHEEHRRSSTKHPSPPSPRRYSQTMRGSSRQSMMSGHKSRRRSQSATGIISEANDLTRSTEHICRTLHSFRKNLASSADILPVENAKELEKELSATARALAEKAARNETVMVKLLDQYSEKLVGMLDEKIAQSVALELGRKAWKSEGAAYEN